MMRLLGIGAVVALAPLTIAVSAVAVVALRLKERNRVLHQVNSRLVSTPRVTLISFAPPQRWWGRA